MPSSPILPWQETHNPEYRIAKGWRIMMMILAPLIVLLFLALPFLITKKVSSIAMTAGVGVVSMVLAGFILYSLLETIKGVFIIGPREISQVGAFKTKTLALNEILGFRIDDKYVNIYPKQNSLPTIKVADTVERYQEVIQWLSGHYADLNRADLEAATAAVLADDAIGDTPEARALALDRAKQVARVLNIAGGAVGAWLIFYPTPYKWAIAAGLLLPVLAMLALWQLPNTLRIDAKKNSAYPSVLVAISLPSLGLLLRALFDYELVSYAPLWPAVGAVAGGTAVLLGLVSRRFLFRQGETTSVGFTMVLLALLYGYGATLATNAVYDKGATTFFATKVLGMHISSGKTTTYYLKLQAWGPVPTAEDVQVSSDYYRQVQPGQAVTMALRPGLLGVPWFTVIE